MLSIHSISLITRYTFFPIVAESKYIFSLAPMVNWGGGRGRNLLKVTDWLVLLASYWLLLTVLLLMHDYDPHEIIHESFYCSGGKFMAWNPPDINWFPSKRCYKKRGRCLFINKISFTFDNTLVFLNLHYYVQCLFQEMKQVHHRVYFI